MAEDNEINAEIAIEILGEMGAQVEDVEMTVLRCFRLIRPQRARWLSPSRHLKPHLRQQNASQNTLKHG